MDFKQLLATMVAQQASDLFITAHLPPSLKIEGVIKPVENAAPLAGADVRTLVFGVMSDKQRAEFEESHECQFALVVEGVGRFRVSAFMERDRPGMVLRRIESRVPTVEELNLPPMLVELSNASRGLLLLVGGNSSGKSTSLAALIGHRNRHTNGHIITIEDPIEFLHEHDGCIVTQREVGVDTDAVEVALHHSLRQAPDVVMIGEIRSRRALEEVISFVEAGHLVLSSIHAQNYRQALDRMVNLFPEDSRRQILSELGLNLVGIVGQMLVPCKDDGGVLPAFEILVNTPLVAETIRRDDFDSLKEIMLRNFDQGMSTFDNSLFQLYRDGRVSMDEALNHAESRNDVRLMMKMHDREVGVRERQAERQK
ncbi:PilT/PilU family type 4a pilus ATPase [Thiorhodovibrio frisius]|uniref:PilT/PilU family type 4a pilus ATPase n=1 Tax=Thiorhodovibrio frisius TaxID=631362 RepID=UPI00022C70FB|nr:PilT/PilU family type 4a pilus ATPase [Thiorhodovibrio frisius]